MKKFILLMCAAGSLATAKPDQTYEYATARYKAAKNATVSRIQHKELAQAQKDFERFVDLYPKDPRSAQALQYIQEIKNRLKENSAPAVSAVETNMPVAPEVASDSLLQKIEMAFDNTTDDLQFKFALSKQTAWTANQLSADANNNLPARVFIDFEKTSTDEELVPPALANNPFVKSVRIGKNAQNRIRVVLDLAQSFDAVKYKVNAVGSDVVLTVSAKDKSSHVNAPVVTASKSASLPIITGGNIKSGEKKGKLRIILDAGHGGEDTGAIGPSGVEEKDVTLQISKKLRDKLASDPKFDVLMTREDDRKLHLGSRTDFANQMGGDLFISIHANANHKPSARGVSTYFLNNADDQESLRVAMRENGDLAPPVGNKQSNLPDDYFLEVMKASMEKNFHTIQSTDLAHEVQSEMLKSLKKKYNDITDLGVRSAGFYVLTGAKMPAILVETSFISNQVEEQRLKNDKYQRMITEAIYNAIHSYFKTKERRNHALLSHSNSLRFN